MIVGQSIPARIEWDDGDKEGVNAVVKEADDIREVEVWIQRDGEYYDPTLIVDRAALDVALRNYDAQANE